MNYSLVFIATLLVFLPALMLEVSAVSRWESILKMPEDTDATRWAVLVAGSNGYGNYRHQADVCHAYQILKKGGLNDENIIVFMYDDIASNILNPRPGVIINHPIGQNVYQGVPKDYTGEYVTAQNLYAVLLGDKKAVKGGSGKVVDSKPNDRIFMYYSDHGGPGVLGMPNKPIIFANDFIETLKKKHKANTYKEMVLYVEACESGSIFEGLMPEDLGIYVTTASNAKEYSWSTYCTGEEPSPPSKYMPCLGDLYSVAWMEDSETNNLEKETVAQQYKAVKERTYLSHVMEYGNKSLKEEKLYLYQGYDSATNNFPSNNDLNEGVVNQRDADLVFLWEKYKRAASGSEEKRQVFEEITYATKQRAHLDTSIQLVGSLLFGLQNGPSVLTRVRTQGLPLVDDWDCLKSMVRVFEDKCGSLTQYGMKHMRAFANVCNNGVSHRTMEEACAIACIDYNSITWHPSIHGGYSA